MLAAYLDESGTFADPSSLCSVIAGYAASEEQWSRFDEKWAAALGKAGAPGFHCKEAFHLRGRFKGWSRRSVDSLYRHLLSILQEYAAFAVATAVDNRAFRKVISDEVVLIKRIGDPYLICFQGCLSQIQSNSQSGGRIQVVLDRKDEFCHQAKENLEKARLDPKHAKWIDRIQSLSFAKSDGISGLQAADILAWETNKYLTEEWKKTGRPLRKSLKSLISSTPHNSWLFDESDLIDFARRVTWAA